MRQIIYRIVYWTLFPIIWFKEYITLAADKRNRLYYEKLAVAATGEITIIIDAINFGTTVRQYIGNAFDRNNMSSLEIEQIFDMYQHGMHILTLMNDRHMSTCWYYDNIAELCGKMLSIIMRTNNTTLHDVSCEIWNSTFPNSHYASLLLNRAKAEKADKLVDTDKSNKTKVDVSAKINEILDEYNKLRITNPDSVNESWIQDKINNILKS